MIHKLGFEWAIYYEVVNSSEEEGRRLRASGSVPFSPNGMGHLIKVLGELYMDQLIEENRRRFVEGSGGGSEG